ncbi:MAG TPA: hypothetical protein H9717_12940 [Candidatus Eisenbergiella merdipullorum]|uniref:Uncharacterized protein n=1 Tax=Candidatus Eisenbergiella merdipullorum TaxID=2838553 RepID=A0A9D2I9G4_9FIRM|nr:hypothetical protein [Candidatus Eisenbergiella merdipullorum]
MFRKFRAKINYAVSIAVLSVVLIYLIIVFLLYSSFLRQDYLQKVIHTCTILSQSVEAHLDNIEESALLFSVPTNQEDEVFSFHTAIYQTFRNMISSNSELLNLAFVTGSECYYYYTTNNSRTGLDEVTGFLQKNIYNNIQENRWYCIPVGNAASRSCDLVYIYLVRDSNGIPAGYLLLFPSPSVFTESLEPLEAVYHDNLSVCLRFDDGSFLPIQISPRAEASGFPSSLSFQTTGYSWSDSRFAYVNVPMKDFNLSFQASIYLQPLFQKQLIMAAGLLVIFLTAAVGVTALIRVYTRNLVSRMEKISKKIEGYSPVKEEGDIS